MTSLHEILGYQVLSTLGHGACSTIFAVKDEDNHVYALKQVLKRTRKDQRFLDQAIQEHAVASQFHHENLRQVYKLIRNRKFLRTSELLILMEMVDGHTLEQQRPRDMDDLCRIMGQIAAALGVMHAAGYAHADIKPKNILITTDGIAKVIDFGQSCDLGTAKERIQGTPDYIAPEQVRRRPITAATDAFNLGATIYWLVMGKHAPTMIPKRGVGLVHKENGDPRSIREENPEVPPALASLVVDCLKTDPLDRPQSMALFLDRLKLARSQVRLGTFRDAASASSDS